MCIKQRGPWERDIYGPILGRCFRDVYFSSRMAGALPRNCGNHGTRGSLPGQGNTKQPTGNEAEQGQGHPVSPPRAPLPGLHGREEGPNILLQHSEMFSPHFCAVVRFLVKQKPHLAPRVVVTPKFSVLAGPTAEIFPLLCFSISPFPCEFHGHSCEGFYCVVC